MLYMESMDPLKLKEKKRREAEDNAKVKPGWALNKRYIDEFKRICDEDGLGYGDILDELIMEYVRKANPKFK